MGTGPGNAASTGFNDCSAISDSRLEPGRLNRKAPGSKAYGRRNPIPDQSGGGGAHGDDRTSPVRRLGASRTGLQSGRREHRPGETIRTLLERAGIDRDEICHIFLNGSLLMTHNSMAPWFEYQRMEGQGMDTFVRDGDRLGLFASDMALLVL